MHGLVHLKGHALELGQYYDYKLRVIRYFFTKME